MSEIPMLLKRLQTALATLDGNTLNTGEAKMDGQRHSGYPKCPECKSSDEVEYTGEDRLSESGELYYVPVYKCYKCNLEFDKEEV